MTTSRREFLTRAACLAGAGGAMLSQASCGAAAVDAAPGAGPDPQAGVGPEMDPASGATILHMTPIGTVEKSDAETCIRVYERYVDGLLGLDGWSHLNVFYWFDKNDLPQRRAMLQVHPRGNPDNPLTGVFACRAPVRPNLIALSACRILSVEGDRVVIDDIDAFDGTPVLDLKPLIPPDVGFRDLRVPDWAGPGPRR